MQDTRNFSQPPKRRCAPLGSIVALSLLSAALCHAQAVNGMQCIANSGVPPTVRAEGLTELAGDIVLICTGGTPIATGSILPQMTLTIFFNTQVTSRLMGSGSEVLLSIDEPTPAQAKVCVPGIPNPGAPTDPDFCPVVGAGGGPTEFKSGNANVIVGTVNGNSVTFTGVPLDPPGNASSRIYRITNIRLNATIPAPGAGGTPGQAIGQIAAQSTLLFAINNPIQIIAFIQPSLATAVRTPDDSAVLTMLPSFSQCTPAPPTKIANLAFAEMFSTNFKSRTASLTTAGGIAVQNTFGTRLYLRVGILRSGPWRICRAGRFGGFRHPAQSHVHRHSRRGHAIRRHRGRVRNRSAGKGPRDPHSRRDRRLHATRRNADLGWNPSRRTRLP